MKPIQLAILGASIWLMASGRATAAQQAQESGYFEVYGGATSNLPGSQAVVIVGRQTVDSGERNVLPTVGIDAGVWWGKSHIAGAIFDFSFVDGGKATASIGSNRSEVRSYLLDGHIGIQVQAPGRVRPYGYAAGGFTHSSVSGTLVLFGATQSADLSENNSSLIYGGGVRVMVGDDSGIRFGVDGVNVAASKDSQEPSHNYARILFGYFKAFK